MLGSPVGGTTRYNYNLILIGDFMNNKCKECGLDFKSNNPRRKFRKREDL